MAFSKTVSGNTVFGNKRVVFGDFTNAAGDTGGDIDTGLDYIDWFAPIVTSHVDTTKFKHTISGGTVTIVCGDDVDGKWIAIGS